MNMICHLVPRIRPPEGVEGAQKLARALAASPGSKPERRLQALINLYNIVWDYPSKFIVLMNTLEFSKTSGLADIMLGVVRANADSWALDLRLSPKDERALYAQCADALSACTRKPKTASKESHRLLVKYLMTFEGTSEAEALTGVDIAAQVVTGFLRSHEMFTFDLAENPAVMALRQSNTKGHKGLYRLLEVYISGSISDFESVAAANPDLFDILGTTKEDALRKMRLLALMGVAHGESELPVNEIASKLQVPEAEVEEIVVQAVARKLIEARIDQLRGVVAIQRCASRSFGTVQWQELQKQLHAWQDGIEHVLKISTEEKVALQEGVAQLNLVAT